MKVIAMLLFLGIVVIAGSLSSCTDPVACFGTSIPVDSIHINQQVVFDGRCSAKANQYFWEFQSTFDSTIAYDAYFTKTFSDSGLVTVMLTVVNGGRSGSIQRTFTVLP